MKITQINLIEIKNIRGIQKRTFQLDILPNKVTILVAPNGFGKSSFATAFQYPYGVPLRYKYKKNNNLRSSLILNVKDDTNIVSTTRDIHSFDTVLGINSMVINSQLMADSVMQKGSRGHQVIPNIGINTITIVDKIPKKVNFTYTTKKYKKNFPGFECLLYDLSSCLKNREFLSVLLRENTLNLLFRLSHNKREKTSLENILLRLSRFNNDREAIKNWIISEEWKTAVVAIESIDYLSRFLNILKDYFIYEREENILGIALQLIFLSRDLIKNSLSSTAIKNACLYAIYECSKKHLTALIKDVNTSWKNNLEPKEIDGKLVVEFSFEADEISNGERDILCFILLLEKAYFELKKDNAILVVDEIFDFLDDANLLTAQYYISQFINRFKSEDRNVFPIILTHLDPHYFQAFVWKRPQIRYFGRVDGSLKKSDRFIKFILAREKPDLKDFIAKHWLHFYPEDVDKKQVFKGHGLDELWGDTLNFNKYLTQEFNKYKNQKEYDPLAICCYVRKRIEENVYNLLSSDEDQLIFLETHGTLEKLQFAEQRGVAISDAYYLLGIIYNQGLHAQGRNFEGLRRTLPSYYSKLSNFVIKKMLQNLE